MKLGLRLEGETFERLVDQARAAEASGLDIAWLPLNPTADTGLIRAAAVAAGTTVIRVAACAPVGGHPVEVAEAAVVVDNCSNGRLVLVLGDDQADPRLLEESVEVVLAALAPRPFRHDGERWTIPGNLPENDQHEERIIVTPQAIQIEVPIWLTGPDSAAVARRWGLAHISREGVGPQNARDAWSETDAALGASVRRLRRPSLYRVDADEAGRFDVDALIVALRADQQDWACDVAVISLPATLGDEARARVAHRLAEQVRPRVTMHQLPPGIERHWQAVLT